MSTEEGTSSATADAAAEAATEDTMLSFADKMKEKAKVAFQGIVEQTRVAATKEAADKVAQQPIPTESAGAEEVAQHKRDERRLSGRTRTCS